MTTTGNYRNKFKDSRIKPAMLMAGKDSPLRNVSTQWTLGGKRKYKVSAGPALLRRYTLTFPTTGIPIKPSRWGMRNVTGDSRIRPTLFQKTAKATGLRRVVTMEMFGRLRRYDVTAIVGAFALTGKATYFPRTYILTAAKGTFTFTPTVTGERVARYLAPATVSFLLTGFSASLKLGRVVPMTKATFTLSGQASTLKTARVIAASVGTLTLTGQGSTLKATRLLAAAKGDILLTGQAASIRADRLIAAAKGTLLLSGQSVTLKAARTLAANTGVFLVFGQDTLFSVEHVTVSYHMDADTASFSWAVKNAALVYGRILSVSSGRFLMSGLDLRLVDSTPMKPMVAFSVHANRSFAVYYQSRVPMITRTERVFATQTARSFAVRSGRSFEVINA